MNDEQLKPCPFCGAVKGIKVWQLPQELWAVKCVDGCSTSLRGYTSRTAVIAAWNRRPEQAAAPARGLEALRVGDPDFSFEVANLANDILEKKWRADASRFPTLTPTQCPRLSIAEVESVIEALRAALRQAKEAEQC